MQLEDILSQLLGTVGDRVGHLRDLWTTGSSADDRFPPGVDELDRLLGAPGRRVDKPEPFKHHTLDAERRAF